MGKKKDEEEQRRHMQLEKFIDIELITLEGERKWLSEYVGHSKFLFIDFWASWCGPCRAENPNVKKIYERYKSKGLEVIGVSLDIKVDAWCKAIEADGLPWLHMSDLKGWECEGAQLYAVRGIPATFMINQEGIIVAKDVRGEEITKKLDELLK